MLRRAGTRGRVLALKVIRSRLAVHAHHDVLPTGQCSRTHFDNLEPPAPVGPHMLGALKGQSVFLSDTWKVAVGPERPAVGREEELVVSQWPAAKQCGRAP